MTEVTVTMPLQLTREMIQAVRENPELWDSAIDAAMRDAPNV